MGVYRNRSRHTPGVPPGMHLPSKKDPARCGACLQPWPCRIATERDAKEVR